MVGATISVPLLLSTPLCILPDDVALGNLICCIIFVSGIVTLVQSTFGVRLPIVQGGTFKFIVPTFALLSLPRWQCPGGDDWQAVMRNMTSEQREEVWQARMREVQGSIICASLFQIVLGGL